MNTILKIIFESSLFASIMILVILSIKRLLLSKINVKIISFLWILVLIRLLLPLTIESPIHVGQFLSFDKPKEMIDTQPPTLEERTSISSQDTSTNPINTPPPLTTATNENTIMFNTIDVKSDPQIRSVSRSMAKQIITFAQKTDIWTYVFAIWIIGVIGLLLKTLISYLSFNRHIKKCKCVNNKAIITHLDTNKALLNIQKEVKILACEYVNFPVTFRLLKPFILLPTDFENKVSESKLNLIIFHECCHIKRKDLLLNYIWLIAKTIHWFNPLVWIAYKQFLEAVELACDEMVLKHISEDESFEYSQSLLDVIKLTKNSGQVPIALSFCEDKTKIRKRVENMLNPKRKRKSVSVIALLLALIMIIGCFTTACEPTLEETVVDVITSNNETNKQNLEKDNVQSNELAIYYVQSDNIVSVGLTSYENRYRDIIIKETVFDNELEMDEQLVNDINMGKVPDIVLFNDRTTLDIIKLAKANIFSSLDEFLKNDDDFDKTLYINRVFDSGIVDDKQIFMPISFNLPTVFFDQDKLSVSGINLSADMTMDQFFNQINTHIDLISDKSDQSTILNFYPSILTQLLRSSNIRVLDNNGNYILKKAELKKVVDYAKIIYQEQNKATSVVEKYDKDFSSLAAQTLLMYWYNIDLPHDVWGYDSLYKDGDMNNMNVLGLPSLNSTGYTATLSLFGAITEQSANKNNAYNFLSLLKDAEACSNYEVVYSMPVNTHVLNDHIQNMSKKTVVSQVNGKATIIHPLPLGTQQRLQNIFSNINQINIPSPAIESIAEQEFLLYMNDVSDFDSCFENFEHSINIYLNE